MNATAIAEKLLGRCDITSLTGEVKEGLAHPDDGAADYKALGVVHMEEPSKPATTHAKTDSSSTSPTAPKLKPSVIKPLRLFPRRKRPASSPDDAARQ